MDDFKAFHKILHISKMYMSITQKIHGSNAQILIKKIPDELMEIEKKKFPNHKLSGHEVFVGSRTRWLTREDDNYGFCNWVGQNLEELIEKLGEGRHYGEWAGPGINCGEGLSEKTFCLFNWRQFGDKVLPANVTTVPVLYTGKLSLNKINEVMAVLKESGSRLVPGYMKPEGIVIQIDTQFYKNVFDDEEVKWSGKEKKIHEHIEYPDITYLLQPLRLEKLLSHDEKYIREYPESLRNICSDYFKDLEAENQFIATDDDNLKMQRKALGREIFYFVKSFVSKE